ncbi:MAG: multidrug efflux RND transporter permease subunit [bacterium]|nr:multidrug efflux RND transporter permease subunit [bacterium]
MGFAHFFVDRPIFAAVLSVLITFIGGLTYVGLPTTQYPEIAPPTIEVRASYPGASAEVVADTVATPLEQEINGVENMLYMSSQSTGDGNLTIAVTFELGTNLEAAQVLVQNRVAIAEPRLPESVRRLGVVTQKSSPDLLMVINLFSPDETYDQLYIANYATLQIRDRLARINGVGQVRLFGASEYAMRVWLDPQRIDSVGLTAGEVVAALRSENVRVSAGVMNQTPSKSPAAFEIGVQTRGRLITPDEFERVVVKAEDDGRIVRLGDVARIELGAQSYLTRGYLENQPAIALPISQTPGTNALETAAALRATMQSLSEEFPPGLAYAIAYDPTAFIAESVDAVIQTIFEAIALVVLVIVIFLQSWRAALIPVVAIPVSLVGTFAVISAFGFSLNNLSLFGLVLAIGIVVDDAIVVVENVERNMRGGLGAREAAHRTMDEVGSALIALGLVLVAVFVPAAFVTGITGQFFRQFALTIASATMISVFVSLTLSPALAALLLEAPQEAKDPTPFGRLFLPFNRGLERFSERYGAFVGRLLGKAMLACIVYVVLLALAALQFGVVPGGFIPAQDQGYAIISIELPSGAELARTDRVTQEVTRRLLSIDGVENAVGFAGFSGATFTNAPNSATIFPTFAPFDERDAAGIDYRDLIDRMWEVAETTDEAFVLVIEPPPVRGIGNAGGVRMMVQDRRGRGLRLLEDSTNEIVDAASESSELTGVFTLFDNQTPQLYLDVDRERARRLNVPISGVFEAVEVYFGSAFVNDFNYLGRTFRVTAQADAPYRQSARDLLHLRTRNAQGEAVPLGSVARAEFRTAPYRVSHYNLFPAASVYANPTEGTSTGESIARLESIADASLPDGFGYEWTELALQEKLAGDSGLAVFALAALFVFLLLAAQYESLSLPLSVILIVPMCLLFAMFGVWITGWDNNILVRVGLIVLVALAAKNAILIVEFAKQREDEGETAEQAALDAARLRLRPILMTAFSFILGVVPLVIASGPGAEMRRSLGITVFSGMLGVTIMGLVFTPLFYVLCRDPRRLLRPGGEAKANEQATHADRDPDVA